MKKYLIHIAIAVALYFILKDTKSVFKSGAPVLPSINILGDNMTVNGLYMIVEIDGYTHDLYINEKTHINGFDYKATSKALVIYHNGNIINQIPHLWGYN